jgi:hypothetical protein
MNNEIVDSAPPELNSHPNSTTGTTYQIITASLTVSSFIASRFE